MELSNFTDLEGLEVEVTEPAPIPETRRSHKLSQRAYERATKAYETIKSLQGPYQELKRGVKRKISCVAIAQTDKKWAAAEDLLNTVIEQRDNIGDMHRAEKRVLLEQFSYGVFQLEEFHEQLHNIQRKERKLFAGDVTIMRNRERILRGMLGRISQNRKDEHKAGQAIADMFWQILAHKHVDREAEQKMFREDLIGLYECQPGGRKTDIWCPISKEWIYYKHMKAAHLVPFKLGYQTMGDLFGEEGRGHELMWSLGNGMMIYRDFEEAFDEHAFCLLPIERPEQPDGWKLVLIDESRRFRKVGMMGETWDFYDGKELEFLNNQRPTRRFLYFHYFLCIYRAMQERTQGWQTVREKSETRKLWATPGPYLRASMLRKLAEVIGDEVDLPAELLADGEIAGPELLDEETEALDAKDIASALLSVDDFDDSELEGDDDSVYS